MSPTLPDLPPIPRHLRALLSTNPLLQRFLAEPPTPREPSPPRSPIELRARLRELVARREVLTRQAEERAAAKAEFEALEPPVPRKRGPSRPAKAKMGGLWLAEIGRDWKEEAVEDLQSFGGIPAQAVRRPGRPRKVRPAVDVATAIRIVADADAKLAREAPVPYDAPKSVGAHNHPTSPPSQDVFSPSASNLEDRPDAVAGVETTASNPEPPRTPNEAGAAWMRFFGRDWLAEALEDIGAPCHEGPRRAEVVKVRGRSCDPVQLELPLPPDVQARKDIPHKAPAEPRVSPSPPQRHREDWRTRLARLETIAGPCRAMPNPFDFDPFQGVLALGLEAPREARAGPRRRRGVSEHQPTC